MPIKSVESFLFERKLVSTSSIEILKDATIGIDVEHYLSRIYTFKKEQFLFGIGGAPSSLESYIESDLSVFKEYNICPIFVFPGLHLNDQSSSSNHNELSPQEQHTESTWGKLYTKHLNHSGAPNYAYLNETFRLNTDPLPTRPIINDLIKFFLNNDIDYMISPYDASFQLSYLYQVGLIDSIYGSTDLLLTKVDKFILGMEFQSKDFRYVDKHKVLKELNLTERQFLDLSIMVGCSAQPITFSNLPPLPNLNPLSPYPQLSYFKLALDIWFQYSSFNGGAGDLSGYFTSLNDLTLIELYYRGHAAIKYMPVLNLEGVVDLYCNELHKMKLIIASENLQTSSSYRKTEEEVLSEVLAIPTEIHSVISQRLPPEVYFYHSLGLIPSELLEAITQGFMSVRPPPEGGLSESYKRLITSARVLEAWDYQFNLVTQLLARYYQVKKIDVGFWFKEEKLSLNLRAVPSVSARLDCMKMETSLGFNLRNFLVALPKQFSSTPRKPEGVGSSVLPSRGSIVASALVRAFYILQLFDHTSYEVQPAVLLLKKFAEIHKDISSNMLEKILLIVLMWSFESYDMFAKDRSYPSVSQSFKSVGFESSLSETEKRMVALASRVFSMQNFKIRPINYQGPISRSLLAMRSQLKFLKELLVSSMEASLVDIVARQNYLKLEFDTRAQWAGLINELPFFSDLNSTLLGVVCEIYLEKCLSYAKRDSKAGEVTKVAKLDLLEQTFQVNNPSFNINLNSVNSVSTERIATDLEEGLILWQYFVSIASMAAELNLFISEANLKLVLETDQLLKKYMPF